MRPAPTSALTTAESRRPGLAALLLGVVLGTALQLVQPDLWAVPGYLGLALAGVAAVWLAGTFRPASARNARLPAAFRPWLAAVGAAALVFALCGIRADHFLQNALDPALEGRDLRVTGTVAAMPQRNEAGLRFRLEVLSVQPTAGPAHSQAAAPRLPPRIDLGWYGTAFGGAPLDAARQPGDLRPGERWDMTVRLKAPHGQANPHGFDYELWLWEQGVQAAGYVRTGARDEPPRRLAATWAHPVEQARRAVRDAIFARVADRRLAGVIAALVVGDQAAIDRLDWDVFRANGVAHLMAISGLHVTMFAWLAVALVGALWRRSRRLCQALPAPHAALIGGVALAAGYALFSGWGVPSQRTVWMLATVSLLRLSGRQWPWPHVWLLACAVVLLADPWALMQAGFWLSFVAVGVLFASGPAQRDQAAVLGPGARLGALLREQWVVTLALAPLTLLLFGQVSVVGLLANAVAIPWVTLVVTPLAMLGVAVAPLWDVAAWAVAGLATGLQWLARWPYATVSVAAAPAWAGVAGVLGGLLLVMRLPPGLRLLGLPLMLPVLLWQAPRPAPGHFELLAADVGQGNAVLVRTARHTLVYDAGPRYSRESDAGHRVLVPLLRALDERVDMLMLSHGDADHTGGAAAVLAMQPQAALAGSLDAAHPLQQLRPVAPCVAGQHWQWDGVDFTVLQPLAEDYGVVRRTNAMSCVLRVSNGGATALLAGDIERAQEARLLAGNAPLAADVLLVPHHGSRTSSTADFIAAVQPRFALVQAGYRNRFGHPAPDVAQRYADAGARLAASPQCGAAHWSSAEPVRLRCQRETARRYWHHRVP